ncbi:DNA ligase 1-like [Copidosoma floridanum]|uniref:DNA ligase 1-like n=1 Tax=Copidosoma floridanum TaxID=29053 RepID=UPI000C6FC194|nr:DNA ligase 1-like [Copidosoma floridanum]
MIEEAWDKLNFTKEFEIGDFLEAIANLKGDVSYHIKKILDSDIATLPKSKVVTEQQEEEEQLEETDDEEAQDEEQEISEENQEDELEEYQEVDVDEDDEIELSLDGRSKNQRYVPLPRLRKIEEDIDFNENVFIDPLTRRLNRQRERFIIKREKLSESEESGRRNSVMGSDKSPTQTDECSPPQRRRTVNQSNTISDEEESR